MGEKICFYVKTAIQRPILYKPPNWCKITLSGLEVLLWQENVLIMTKLENTPILHCRFTDSLI